MGTLVLNESTGTMNKTKEQIENQKIEDSTKLRELIPTSCEKAELQATPELIAQAKQRFNYSNDKLYPQSIYRSLDQFINEHNHKAPKIGNAMEDIDKRAMKKKELYEQLNHYANINDMRNYRLVRAQYSLL